MSVSAEQTPHAAKSFRISWNAILIDHDLDPEEPRELAPTIPFELIEEFMFVGNATEITDRISGYADNGLERIILGDVTGVHGLDEINANTGRLQSLVAGLGQFTAPLPPVPVRTFAEWSGHRPCGRILSDTRRVFAAGTSPGGRMPLPVGTWKANLNGTVFDLTISGVDPQGLFPVTLLNVDTQGFWNEVDQSLSIGLVLNFGGAVGQGVVTILEACLFRSPTNPQAGQDVTATLAGTFRVTAGTTAFPATPSSRRSVFGWYAQITEVI